MTKPRPRQDVHFTDCPPVARYVPIPSLGRENMTSRLRKCRRISHHDECPDWSYQLGQGTRRVSLHTGQPGGSLASDEADLLT